MHWLSARSWRSVTALKHLYRRDLSTKATGDISAVFPSLSGKPLEPLPPRIADIKQQLLVGHETEIQVSWRRLLGRLKDDIDIIQAQGSSIIPDIAFSDVKYDNVDKLTSFRDQLHERGVAIIRGVVSEEEALGLKTLLRRYIKDNPSTPGFPPDHPTVYELYWSPSQVLARAHPNVLKCQQFLMSHWHAADKTALVSTSHPLSYADRLRLREPGDIGFTLGPHVDGGSCERWEPDGYGKGGVYDAIYRGCWEEYSPWESTARLPVVSDLYNGAGACSMFRMFQGWLSMSNTKAGEGTLMVNPLFRLATAYYLLRPFFEERLVKDVASEAYLEPENWQLASPQNSLLQGAVPGTCQEFSEILHPHLQLAKSMVHVPDVQPGDYVAWHCDILHGVDKIHAGKEDSSVLYIPACPLTENNAQYLARQREAFLDGHPGPDFPSGVGEADHLGRLTPDFAMKNMSQQALQAMGLSGFDTSQKGLHLRNNGMLERANEILGFKDKES